MWWMSRNSGSLNLLVPPGPVPACNRIALGSLLSLHCWIIVLRLRLSVSAPQSYAMKAYGWAEITRLMYLGTRWSWVGSFMPFSFYPWGKSTRGSLDRKLGWLQSWSRRGVDRSLPTHRESNPNPSSVFHNLVTILAELRCRWKVVTVVNPRKPRVIQANLAEKMRVLSSSYLLLPTRRSWVGFPFTTSSK